LENRKYEKKTGHYETIFEIMYSYKEAEWNGRKAEKKGKGKKDQTQKENLQLMWQGGRRGGTNHG
jgi:hypothetical protein